MKRDNLQFTEIQKNIQKIYLLSLLKLRQTYEENKYIR